MVLGTDGRSSNPDLSIWKELQQVASLDPAASADQLLPMVTTASVLIPEDSLTDLPPSAFTGLATVIRLPEGRRNDARSLLSAESRPVGRVR